MPRLLVWRFSLRRSLLLLCALLGCYVLTCGILMVAPSFRYHPYSFKPSFNQSTVPLQQKPDRLENAVYADRSDTGAGSEDEEEELGQRNGSVVGGIQRKSAEMVRKDLVQQVLQNTSDFSNASNETQYIRRPPEPFELLSWELPSDAYKRLPLCPESPPDLRGHLGQAVLLIDALKVDEVISSHPELRNGGSWRPRHCRARHKIAVIVPFRDRQSHLNRLLDFLIPILQRQLLDFRFIVTEQYGHDLFNKGKIMNAAFTLAERMGVDCVVFHDVDMFPQDDRGSYGCHDQPMHLGVFVNSLGYELWYEYIVGGALTIRTDHYRQVNGYSNMYWAWGGEDDDMGKRILANNFKILRPPKEYARYTMIKHKKRQRTAPKLIYKLLDSAGTRFRTDGLSNSHEWRIVKVTRKPVYYHLFVDVGLPPKEWRS